jgi:mannose-6-phosphate isomerase-like protein (cupin superfamily)
MCPGTYIPVDELQAYTKKAIAEKRIDQQVRDVDIGKAHVAIGMVYRGRLDAPEKDSVAEHDQVSEVYHIIDGSGTLVLGPDIVGMKRRPADSETVRLFNGPGNNGAMIREGKTYYLKPATRSSFRPAPGTGSRTSTTTSPISWCASIPTR